MTQAIHNTKGRARYQVKRLYRSETVKQYLELQLLNQPGILTVAANTLTGNILVQFHPAEISTVEVTLLITQIEQNYQPPGSETPAASIITGTQEQKTADWHLMTVDTVLAELETSAAGLTPEAAIANLHKYGANVLPATATRSELSILFESGVLTCSTLTAYGYGIMRYGIGPQASTIAFMSLTLEQLLHALSCRTTHSIFATDISANQYLNAALAGSLGLQLLAVGIPGLKDLLNIAPIDALDSIVIGSSAILPLLVNESTKKSFSDAQVNAEHA